MSSVVLSFKEAVLGPAPQPEAAPCEMVGCDHDETLVLLELNYVARGKAGKDAHGDHGDGHSRSTSFDRGSSDGGSCSSEESVTDCTVLAGPDVFVEAKLIDVSASNSRYATDSEEGEAGGSSSSSSVHGGEDYGDPGLALEAAEEENSSLAGSATPQGPPGSENENEDGEPPPPPSKDPPKRKKKALFVNVGQRSLAGQGLDSSGLGHGANAAAAFPDSPMTPHDYNFAYPSTPAAQVRIELDCPQKFVGRIIGKRGSTVRNLEQKTGCRIQIDQSLPEGAPRRVTITGHPALIDEAEKVVQEVIDFGPPELNKKNVYKSALNSMACENAKARNKSAARAKRNLFASNQQQQQQQRQGQRRGVAGGPQGSAGMMLGGHESPPQQQAYPFSPPAASFGFGPAAPASMPFFHPPPPMAPMSPMHGMPPMPPMPQMPQMPAMSAAGGNVGNMYIPGYPPAAPTKPSFKVVSTAAVATARFWAEHRTPTGKKYFIDQYTGELMTSLSDDDTGSK
mmetsp:Transcript_9317/g.23119  ORF Transcript_9317/g.23119 Transcript_9317/m.23119 type:complete len:511 (+) Transcript_9317:457-1989(+)